MTTTYLFEPNLICEVKFLYRIRPLNENDYENGYMDLLKEFRASTLEETCETFMNVYTHLKHQKSYYIVVVEDVETKQVIGTGTLFIEQKFIHNYGRVGHIEDVVVSTNYRNNGIGKMILQQLKHIGKELNVYKLILNCSTELVPFYKKHGFSLHNSQMSIYLQ